MFKPAFTVGLQRRGASRFPAAGKNNLDRLCFNWLRGIPGHMRFSVTETARYLITYGYEQTG
jgi:hypothetical protein